jgi:2-iminobutanoate/2-iminopropanoate deaminase
MMALVPINAPVAPEPIGGYSQAVKVVDAQELLFVSGQIPVSREGVVPADFTSQCRMVWAHILAQLAEARMTVRNIVKVTTFLSDRRDADENGEIRRAVLGEHRPALTVIITGIFDPAWLVEIEAVAAKRAE